MTSNKTTKEPIAKKIHRWYTTKKGPTSQFDRRTDVGLNLAGGAQKLPGPHRTTRKGTSKEPAKEPAKEPSKNRRISCLSKIYFI